MEERGIGYAVDMLVFALLTSTAILLLSGASPVDPEMDSTRYAADFAQSSLLSLQHSTADQFGGFEYRLDVPWSELPVVGDSARRELRYKTLAELLTEDALLNLRMEVAGVDFAPMHTNKNMDDGLGNFLKSALDQIIGGRFCYLLHAKTNPIDLGFARAYFETEVDGLPGARNQLCSETLVLSLPASHEQFDSLFSEVLGLLELETDPIMEITLELWSR